MQISSVLAVAAVIASSVASANPLPPGNVLNKIVAIQKVAQANQGNGCTFGAYQCVDTYTLQQCGYVAGNVLAWESFESCQQGTVCTIRGSFVGCDYPNSNQPGYHPSSTWTQPAYGPTSTWAQPVYTPPPTYVPTTTAAYTHAPTYVPTTAAYTPPPTYAPTTAQPVYTAPPPTYAPTTTTAAYTPPSTYAPTTTQPAYSPPPPVYQPSTPVYQPTTWTQPSYQPSPTYGPSGGQCTFGGYRCVDPYTLQQCGYGAGNVLQWESFESCQTGTVCTIRGSFVGCDFPSNAAGFAAGVDAAWYGPTTPAYTPPPPTYVPTTTAVYTPPPPPVYSHTTTTAAYTPPPPPPTYVQTTTTAVYSPPPPVYSQPPPPPATYQPSTPVYSAPTYQPPSTPTYGGQCHFGGYRCVDPYTLQQCGYGAGNVLQWESFESCQTGTVCTIRGSFVGCDYPSS